MSHELVNLAVPVGLNWNEQVSGSALTVTVDTRAASEQSLALSSGAVQGAPNVLHQQQDAQQEQARQAQKAMGV